MTQLNNIKLETSRLYLIPLTYDQVLMYANLDAALPLELGIMQHERTITDLFKSTIENYIIPYLHHNPLHFLYATIWVMVLKEENIMIGDIGFNAAPSSKGVIEVGYSTYPEFMNKGYMTEALGAMIKWAFKQPEAQIIIAQTDKNNLPTHKVLSKNNFFPFAEADSYYWWRLDKERETVEDS